MSTALLRESLTLIELILRRRRQTRNTTQNHDEREKDGSPDELEPSRSIIIIILSITYFLRIVPPCIV
ncbi:MAG: hypothetical protein V7K47_05020 [Nostoc sp.]